MRESPKQRAVTLHLLPEETLKPPATSPPPGSRPPPGPLSHLPSLQPPAPRLTSGSAAAPKGPACCSATWRECDQRRVSGETHLSQRTVPAVIPLVGTYGDALSNRPARKRAGSCCDGAGLRALGSNSHEVGGASRAGGLQNLRLREKGRGRVAEPGGVRVGGGA